jgi:trehalose-phosphatase
MQADRIALFTDFDGTLVRIHRRATAVRLSERVRRVLKELVARGHLVGVVSGRALDDLRARIGLPGLWYVGGHGFLLCTPTNHTAVLASRRQRLQIERVSVRLRDALAGASGITIDPKVAAIAVHYRNATRAGRARAGRALKDVLARESNLQVMLGKKVWEVMPAGPVNKAVAVRFILRWERRQEPGANWIAIYVGDDVADERVFARWSGISVIVGRRSRTAARYYLQSPAEVRAFLDRLRGIRTCDRQKPPFSS